MGKGNNGSHTMIALQAETLCRGVCYNRVIKKLATETKIHLVHPIYLRPYICYLLI